MKIQKWTPEENILLAEKVQSGESVAQIAIAMSRSEMSIKRRIYELNLLQNNAPDCFAYEQIQKRILQKKLCPITGHPPTSRAYMAVSHGLREQAIGRYRYE